MLTKNATLKLECTALGADFEGICRYQGQVVFVSGALPGETIRARIIKVTKRYAIGRLEQVMTFSEERLQPPCAHYPRCGGCTAQHLRYEATLAYKRQQVLDCLERIGGFDAPEVAEVIGMEDPWRYRNKGAFPVGGKAGTPVIGIYAARSHDIIDAPTGCLLQTRKSDALVAAVRHWMRIHHVEPYEEMSHRGLIRHIVTREAADGKAMLVLAINGKAIPHQEELIAVANEAVPDLRSIVLSENTRPTNVILGNAFRTIWGEDTLEDTIAGFRMRVSPRSFFQVNRSQAERLYASALEMAGLTGSEKVWDLYCGCGSITLPLARHAAHVTGVEIVEDAVADARENARRNGAENVRFIAGATEDVLTRLMAEDGSPDVVVLDPPRKGCEPDAVEAVAKAGPSRIVYVSCNPATLARDAKLLAENGYRLDRVQPVDMFGWTGHTECVMLMTKDLGENEKWQ